MTSLKYTKPEVISLKNHPELNEVWVRQRIEEDPSILGLGDLELRDVERPQPKAGRLDLLLRDPETRRRYEVELQLGPADESHIIRTIEYWDIERKRYPKYDHCAVLVAEDITARFLNVIGLFNGHIPLIAIQMTALKVGDHILLQFTRVLDEVEFGGEEEDEEISTPVDRNVWKQRIPEDSLAVVDECLQILNEIDPRIGLTYRKYFIGLAIGGAVNNFIYFSPKRRFVRVSVRTSKRPEWMKRLEDIGLDVLSEGARRVRFRLTLEELRRHNVTLKELFQDSYKESKE